MKFFTAVVAILATVGTASAGKLKGPSAAKVNPVGVIMKAITPEQTGRHDTCTECHGARDACPAGQRSGPDGGRRDRGVDASRSGPAGPSNRERTS